MKNKPKRFVDEISVGKPDKKRKKEVADNNLYEVEIKEVHIQPPFDGPKHTRNLL